MQPNQLLNTIAMDTIALPIIVVLAKDYFSSQFGKILKYYPKAQKICAQSF